MTRKIFKNIQIFFPNLTVWTALMRNIDAVTEWMHPWLDNLQYFLFIFQRALSPVLLEVTIPPTLLLLAPPSLAQVWCQATTLIRSVGRDNYSDNTESWSSSYQETDCQAYHVCGPDNGNPEPLSTLLCPNGTLYNQQYFVCDWWFNVDCSVVRLSQKSLIHLKQFSFRLEISSL